MRRTINIVFSGGPNVGKTTILNELRTRGFETRPEVFTAIFSHAQKEGKFEELFQNKKELMSQLIQNQKENETYGEKELRYLFLDRGMVDITGFAKEIEYELDTVELSTIHQSEYDLCFIPEPLNRIFYDQNSVRRQTYEESLERHQQCVDAYISYFKNKKHNPDHHLIFIPDYNKELHFNFSNKDELLKSSVQKRADFVLKTLENFGVA